MSKLTQELTGASNQRFNYFANGLITHDERIFLMRPQGYGSGEKQAFMFLREPRRMRDQTGRVHSARPG
jgi:hypothetical protein